MVVRAGELVALPRPDAQRRMLAGVEEHGGVHAAAAPIEHLEIDRVIGVRRRARDEIGDPIRACRRLDASVGRETVPHGRWWIVVHRAEVALSVDERVAQRERLRHTHERVVDRLVAVRVVLTHDVADRRGGLLVRLVRLQPRLVHAVQHAPMDGLEAVAHVGQRTADDDRHGVVEVARAHLLLELARLDAAGAECSGVYLRHRGTSRLSRCPR